MIDMFKIMKGIDKISADELFNRVDSDRTRGHSLREKKRRVKMVERQGSFTQRVVNAWNGLPGKVVAAEKVDKFKLEQVWRLRWFTSNVHGSPFLFFDLRGDATGKLAGIGKNVNDDKSEDDDGSRVVFDDVDCFRSQG